MQKHCYFKKKMKIIFDKFLQILILYSKSIHFRQFQKKNWIAAK